MSTVLQALIDQASPGSTVVVPAGSYQIDAVNDPLRLKSNVGVDLTGVTLTAIPNSKTNYKIVSISHCENVSVINGHIKGERDTHLGSTDWSAGGWGFGIYIGEGSRNVSLQRTVTTDCFGDGVYVSDAYNVSLEGIVSDKNRRQGMSVIHVDGLHVSGCQFSNSGGTPPGSGIDFECDLDGQRIINVVVEKSKFFGNAGSCIAFGSPGQYHNIRVMGDNTYDHLTQPIYATGNAAPLGTPWWAFLLNRTCSWLPQYRWWGYRTDWYKA